MSEEKDKVQEGDQISLHYTGSLDDGTVFDSSEGREPLEFKVGAGQVIPGFDENVRGMEVGESRDFSILPEQAYGDYHEEYVQVVPRSIFPPDVTPAVGLMLELQTQSGETIPFRIIDVTDDEVTLDPNHLLAGEKLNFTVKLVDINRS